MAFAKVENGVVVQKSSTHRADFVLIPDDVVCGYVVDQNGVFVPPPKRPEDIACDAKAAQDEQDAKDAKADAKFQELIGLKPAQAKQWAKDTFPTLTLPEQRAIGILVAAIALLGRRL
jgi:regulator of RNase E activity RraA